MGPVQIQAARVVPFAHAKRNERDSRQDLIIQTEKNAPRLAVQVLDNRQRGFSKEREPAGAGLSPVRIFNGIEPKDADARNEKTAAGEQTERRHASFAAPGAVAHPDFA